MQRIRRHCAMRPINVRLTYLLIQHAVSRSADCRSLLRRLASTVQNMTISFNVRFFRLWLSPLCCQSWTIAYFKPTVIVYRALHVITPRYLSDQLSSVGNRCCIPSRESTSVVNFQPTYCPSVASCHDQLLLLLLAHGCGTVFRMTLHRLHHRQ